MDTKNISPPHPPHPPAPLPAPPSPPHREGGKWGWTMGVDNKSFRKIIEYSIILFKAFIVHPHCPPPLSTLAGEGGEGGGGGRRRGVQGGNIFCVHSCRLAVQSARECSFFVPFVCSSSQGLRWKIITLVPNLWTQPCGQTDSGITKHHRKGSDNSERLAEKTTPAFQSIDVGGNNFSDTLFECNIVSDVFLLLSWVYALKCWSCLLH